MSRKISLLLLIFLNLCGYTAVFGMNSQGNQTDEYGNTPLHYACRMGNVEIVKLLLKQGSDVNVKNEFGSTPLFYAGEIQILQMLLSNGSDVNAQDDDGNAPLHYAAKVGNYEIVCELLKRLDIKVNIQNHGGKTPLHYAVEMKKCTVVAKLLGHKNIDILVNDDERKNPLWIAEQEKKKCDFKLSVFKEIWKYPLASYSWNIQTALENKECSQEICRLFQEHLKEKNSN
jgi:ankyrin repeat protein